MGAFESCFGADDNAIDTPDPELKRQQMLQAAEKRKALEESRGIKNPEKFREQQKKKAEAEKAVAQGGGSGHLKWNVG